MYRPHDLLWLADQASLLSCEAPPAWATPAWLAIAPVVVRRATPAAAGHVAVGLRGMARHERCAAQVPASQVLRSQAPEAVLDAWLRRGAPCRRRLPCLRALPALVPEFNGLPPAWGRSGRGWFTPAPRHAGLGGGRRPSPFVAPPPAPRPPRVG